MRDVDPACDGVVYVESARVTKQLDTRTIRNITRDGVKKMDAWKLALLLFATWVLVRFWLHPTLERSWVNGDLKVKALRAGTFAALEMSRTLLARVLMVLAAVLVILVISGWLGSSGTVFPERMISMAAGWAEGFHAIQSDTLGAITVLTIIAAGIVLYRTARAARARVRARLMEHIEATRQKLSSDHTLMEKLAADSQFTPVLAELQALGERRAHIQGLESPVHAKFAEELKNLEVAIGQRSNFIVVTYAMRDFDPAKALATAAPKENEEKPQSHWGRAKAALFNFLGSRGLAHDLGLVKKNTERIATVLMVISLLSWSSAAMANSLQLAATNLQVVFDKDRATRSLDQALSELPPPTPSQRVSPPNSEITRVSRTLAREFTKRIVQRDLPATLGLHPESAARYDDEATRLAVLQAQIEPVHPSDTDDQIRAESLSADIRAKGANERGEALSAKLSDRIAARLAQIHDQSATAWAAIVEHTKQHYDEPIELWDAQEKVLDAALEQVLDIEPEAGSEITRQGAELMSEFGKNALSSWIDARMEDYLGSVVLESLGPDFAFRTAPPRPMDSTLHSDSREVLDKAWPSEGAGGEPWHTVRTNSVTGDDQSRHAMLAKVNELTNGDVQPEIRDAIMGYDGTFPGRSRTVAEAVADTVRPAANELASGATQAAMQAAVDFFGAARGGLARGVIFGRAPLGDAPALSDLRWSSDGTGRLRLEVRPAAEASQPEGASQWKSLGSYASATINEALRYAADRRVVAVTMVSGEPFARLQIQLNPELVDTPLGCRVIMIDRFVDTLDPRIPQAHAHRQAVNKLQILMEVAATQPADLCQAPSVSKSLRKMLEISGSVPTQFTQKVLTELNHDDASIAILNSALQCGSKTTAENMLACACQANSQIAAANGVYVPNDVTSQVREKSFVPDAEFSWMHRTGDALGNVQFWLHMTLAWEPKKGASDPSPPNQKSTLAVDFADEDLDALNIRMPGLVRDYVTAPQSSGGLGANYTEFMQPVEDFVILQRFFRLALDSRFGPSFPKQKLVQLERDTRDSVPKQITLRWQVETQKQAELLKAASNQEFGLWQQYSQESRNGESCAMM